MHNGPSLYVWQQHPSQWTEYRQVKVSGCPDGLRMPRKDNPRIVAGPFPAKSSSLDALGAWVAQHYGTTSAEWALEDAARIIAHYTR